MIVSVLTCYALLHSTCDLIDPKVKVQCSLIQELILYSSELGHNTAEATKNICCAKDEKIGRRNFILVARTSMTRQGHVGLKLWILCSKLNLVSRIWRVSGRLGISHTSVVHYLHDFDKSIWAAEHCQNITKHLTHSSIKDTSPWFSIRNCLLLLSPTNNNNNNNNICQSYLITTIN